MSRYSRLALPWGALLLVALLAATIRYGLIERSAMGQLCGSENSPLWCTWRQWLVLGFLHNVYGIAAVVAAATAMLWKSPWLAWLAAALGAFALVLYCFEAGALALLMGCLRLLRLQAHALRRLPPVKQHRQADQYIQPQP
ncbi:MAG: hypothetical protein ACTS5I_01555 [Rhodanobacter sp.]